MNTLQHKIGGFECNPPNERGCDPEKVKNVRYCCYYGHQYCKRNCLYALEMERRKKNPGGSRVQ